MISSRAFTSRSNKCYHKIKRIYTHGRNAQPKWICKICGNVLGRNEHKKELEREHGKKKRDMFDKRYGR